MSTADPRALRPPGRPRSTGRPRLALVRIGVALASAAGIFLSHAAPARAHPASQGRLDVVVFPDRVSVRATVSAEEVLVASAASGRESGSPLRVRRVHGDYLLGHLHVSADGVRLAGRVVARPETLSGRPTYEIEFPLSSPRPARLVFREDVLRDFEFAPGIPWEASYAVQIGHDGRDPAGLMLLNCREPLVFACDWGAEIPAPDAARESGRSRMAMAFVRHGIMHILAGWDHLLFVSALVLAARGFWDLIKVISAFTLAHTLTLAASTLGLVRLPEGIVEPMIAASIVFVAAQNIVSPGRSQGGGRILVAFLFGLFHGLGFAGGLIEAGNGLDPADLAWAIGAFSVGVEIGHQVVVIPAFGVLSLVRRTGLGTAGRDRLVEVGGSAVISVLGAAYLALAF